MKNGRIIAKILIFIFILTAVFDKGSLFSDAAVNEGQNMVRVGLTKEYLNKISIRLDNSALKIGFSKDDIYYPTDILRGDKGISISRDYGTYSVYGGSFPTYAKAASEAASLKASNKSLTAVPALIGLDSNGRGVWKLYDVYSAENTLNSNDIYGTEIKNRKSKYMLAIIIGRNKFIVDAAKFGANPQFEPIDKSEGISINGENRYRGRIEIGTYGKNGITPVNVINLEDYVRGSVPLEMTYTWHSSALKAQAVCARSFGVAVSGFGSDSDIAKGYKLTNTISHQSYGGMKAERKETDKAVKETENEFVTYKNRIIKTTYFSTSGGYTEDSENVWGSKKLWLRAVPDPYENKPEKKPWAIGFTKGQISNMISDYAAAKGKDVGAIEDIKVTKRSESGRALMLLVEGSRGSLTLEKQEIRKAFNLYSTKIKVYSSYEFIESLNGRKEIGVKGDFIFSGSGYGHGVGLSQSGARGMAEAGYGYKKILMHYFTGVEVH